MMLTKKGMSLLLALALLLSTCVFAVSADEEDQTVTDECVLEAAQPLFDALETYYSLESASVTFFDDEVAQADGSIDVPCVLKLQLSQRAQSVTELPYVMGMLDGLAMTLDECFTTALGVTENVFCAMGMEVSLTDRERRAWSAADFIQAVSVDVGSTTEANYMVMVHVAPDGTVSGLSGCIEQVEGTGYTTFPLSEYFPDAADDLYASGYEAGTH